MKLRGGGKKKFFSPFFLGELDRAFFTVNLSSRRGLVVFASSASLCAITTEHRVTCAAQFCQNLFLLPSFALERSRRQVERNLSHFHCFFCCRCHQHDSHLNSIKLGQWRRSESVLRMILRKELATMNWANIFERSSSYTRARKGQPRARLLSQFRPTIERRREKPFAPISARIIGKKKRKVRYRLRLLMPFGIIKQITCLRPTAEQLKWFKADRSELLGVETSKAKFTFSLCGSVSANRNRNVLAS